MTYVVSKCSVDSNKASCPSGYCVILVKTQSCVNDPI